MTAKFKISQAADFLGVSTKTLRRWDTSVKLIPFRTKGGQRYYTRVQLEKAIHQKSKQIKPTLTTADSGVFQPAIPAFDYQESFQKMMATSTPKPAEPLAVEHILPKPFIPFSRNAFVFRSIALAVTLAFFLNLYDFSGFLGFVKPKKLAQSTSEAISLLPHGLLLKANPRKILTGRGATPDPVTSSQVLAATDINLPFHFAVGVPAIFSQNITAPNVIYSITAGDGISISGDQNLTISGSGNNWLSMKVGSTSLSANGTSDIFEYAGSGSVTLALDSTNKKLTITGSTDASTLEGLASTAFLRSNTSDEYTSGTLSFSDGTFLDLSAITHNDSALQGFRLPQGTALTAMTSGRGFLAYDTTNEKVKVFDGSDWVDISGAATTLQDAYGAGNTIELSAALGNISFYNDTATQILFLQQSNGYLGIGTTTPNSKLDVLGDTTVNGNVGFGTSLYWNNTTSRLGIGTTTPSYTTDIAGTLRVTGSGFTGLMLPTGASENYVLTTDGAGNASWTDTSGGGSFGAWTLTGSTIYPNETTYNLVLGSTSVLDSVAKLVNTGSTLYKSTSIANLPSGGALGTAAATVDIYTTFNVNQTTTGQTISLPTPTSDIAGRLVYVSNTGSVPFTFLSSTVTAGTTTQAMWNGTAWTLAGSNAGLPVGTANNTTMRWNTATSTWQENTSLIATSTGLVGIGVTSPQAKLDLLSTTEQLRLSYSSSVYLGMTVDSNGNLTFSDSGTSVAKFGSESAEFYVPTTFSAAGDVSVAYDIILENQAASQILSKGPFSLVAGQSFENNNLTLKTYGTGDVLLDLSGTGNLELLATDPHIVFNTKTATDTDFWLGVVEDAGGDDDDIFSIGKGVGVGTSTYFTLNGSGNVGIGTTSPGTRLSVTGGVGIGTTDSFANAAIAANNLAVQGSVGIGTTSPREDLDIVGSVILAGSSGAGMLRPAVGTSRIEGEISGYRTNTLISDDGFLRLSAGGGSTANTKTFIDLAGYSTYGSGAEMFQNIVFGTSGVQRMRITDTGNVGIGTTIPAAKLAVVGGVGIGTTNAGGFANAAIAANNLAVQGKIGIGITNPRNALEVKNNPSVLTGQAALVVDQYENQDLLTASASGVPKFMVNNSGQIYMGVNTTLATSTAVCWEEQTVNGVSLYKLGDCTGTPADLAEFYPVGSTSGTSEVTGTGSSDGLPVAGEIVSIAQVVGTYTTSDGVTHQAFGVKKATADTTHKMAGVVSTKAWQVIGEDVLEWAESAVPVALSGRVPVKISPSSASITAGDMITSSDDIPGAGKKSDGNGYIIGKALENWDPANPTNSILVFLQNSVNIADLLKNPSGANDTDRLTNLETEVELLKAVSLTANTSTLTENISSLNVQNINVLDSSILGDVTITGNLQMGLISVDGLTGNINSASKLSFMSGLIEMDIAGNILVKEGVIMGNSTFRDEISVPAGQSSIIVAKSWTYVPVSISITPTWNTTVWITGKNTTGFTVNFGSPAPAGAKINWLAVF